MLDKLKISGFKSIKNLGFLTEGGFDLLDVNLLIGGNGAGKSNLIEFFKMLRAMMGMRLAEFRDLRPSLARFLDNKGGLQNFLHGGLQLTREVSGAMVFNSGKNGYRFNIIPTADGSYSIGKEEFYYDGYFRPGGWTTGYHSGDSYKESILPERYRRVTTEGASTRYQYIYEAIQSWQIYQFHDTSQFAGARMPSLTSSGDELYFDGGNIAAFLYRLKCGDIHVEQARQDCQDAYENIVDMIRIAAPYFDDFILEPYREGDEERVKLQWRQKEYLMKFQPHHLSDGTLRFICLSAVLLQPKPPQLVIIDEPELGLHPEALEALAELIHRCKSKTQFILATQSPSFADFFKPSEVVTVTRSNGESIFERQSEEKLSAWLEQYSIGQLWRKNVIRGGITNG